ncbi:MAG: NUDIX domain-containing protein [Paracoccaceae bacterium]
MGLAALALRMGGEVQAIVLGGAAPDSAEARARLAFWQAATGGEAELEPGLERALAEDIMALFGKVAPDRLRARRGPMLVRAASRLRARQAPLAQGLRRAVGPEDCRVAGAEQVFAGFFAVETVELSYRRFDGGMSAPVHREVFIGCDAVSVLPYDPVRDRVLVIEQIRSAPLLRGEANPWQIEAVAGRIDAGETPEGAGRREALEEAGLRIGGLEKVAEYYPSTAAFTEYLYSYVGLCDLPDGAGGIFGLAEESEDIRGHLLGLDDLAARLEAGEIGNAPLIISLQWLLRHRGRLRAAAGI